MTNKEPMATIKSGVDMHRDGLGRVTWYQPPEAMPGSAWQPPSVAPIDRMKWEKIDYDISVLKQHVHAMRTAVEYLVRVISSINTTPTVQPQSSSLPDEVDHITKVIQSGQISPKHVNQLTEAISRYKQDRAVGDATKRQ